MYYDMPDVPGATGTVDKKIDAGVQNQHQMVQSESIECINKMYKE